MQSSSQNQSMNDLLNQLKTYEEREKAFQTHLKMKDIEIQKLEKESENKDVRNRSFSCLKTNDNTNILSVKSHMTICMNKKRRYQITVTLNNTKYVYTTVQQGLFRHILEKLFKRKLLNISYGIKKGQTDVK